MDIDERLKLLNIAFSPTAPIKKQDFFTGRIDQLRKICDAINEEGQHAILYGERGVGKTSLANIMTEALTNLYPIKITCSRGDTFFSLWSQALKQVKYSKTTKGIGFKPTEANQVENLGKILTSDSFSLQSDIISLVGALTAYKFLFIFDEFDNITDSDTRAAFADLIKAMSDNNSNATIVLVGIADDVETLIGNHQSLERCLKQIKMPRMSSEECSSIITKGLSTVGISIPNHVQNQIVDFASGFPHYVHLLCKFGAQEVIRNNKTELSKSYLNIAIRLGIENTGEILKSVYHKATEGSDKWMYVLFACSSATIDKYGSSTKSDILKSYNLHASPLGKSNSISYNLIQLCEDNRGKILSKIGKSKSVKYRFSNPMMRAFVKLKINSHN